MGTKNMSKRFVQGFIVLGIVVLSACGKEEAAPNQATQRPAATTAPTTAAAEEQPALSTLAVSELLKRAKVAESKDQLVAPAGDNAVEYYLAVIEKEPNNAIASQAVIDIFPLTSGVVERLLQQRNLDEAARVVQMLDKATPDSYTVKTLKDRLKALQDSVAREEQQRLIAEEQTRAAAELAARQPQQTPAQIAAAEQAAQEQQAAQERAAREAASAAAATSTPAIVASTDTTPQDEPEPVVPKGETKAARLVRAASPVYPRAALARRQEGWVEIEATVGVNGAVTNAIVLRADPPRVFDREAVSSAQKWSFDPALRDGRAVESKFRRRIEFKL